jgi:O-antigen/teichoic acid export membrane protein
MSSAPNPEAGTPPTAVDPTSTLAGPTLAYGLSRFIVPVLGLITLPIFARALTHSEYGLLELATAVTFVALILMDCGLTNATQRSYFDYTAEHAARRHSVVLTAFVTTTFLAIVVTAAMLAFRDNVAAWLLGDRGATTLAAVVALSLIPMNTARFLSETMRLRFQARNFLVSAAIAGVVASAVGLVGVVGFDGGSDAIILGVAIGNALAALYAFVVVRDALSGGLSRFELRRMLAFGLPLLPAALAAWSLSLVDRIILTNLKSLEEVGQYAIATRVSYLLVIATAGFILALGPFLLATYSESPPQELATRGRTLTYLAFILCSGALVLTLFAKEAIAILAPAFDDAYKAVGPLALGGVAYGLASVLMIGVAISRRTSYIAVATLLAAAVNIALNFALIPPFGFVGSAIAAAIGYGVLAVSYYYVAQRVYPTPYELAKIIWIVAAATAVSLLGVLSVEPMALELALKLLGLAGFLSVVWVTGAIRVPELIELRRFAAAALRRQPSET